MTTTQIEHKFKVGDRVEVALPCGWPAGVFPATISSYADYLGRPGYYVSWVYGRRREQWESEGGWKPEAVLSQSSR